MLYMIIETFHPGKVKELYKRFEEKGRQLPAGVLYVNNWITESVAVCYQVIESDSEGKIHTWIQHWADLADFQIIPVITSTQAKEKIDAG